MDVIGLGALCLAVFVFFKLRGILGEHGGDHNRQTDYIRKRQNNQKNKKQTENKKASIIDLPKRENLQQTNGKQQVNFNKESLEKKFAHNPQCLGNLLAIYAKDENFHIDDFVKSAKQAYETIVIAFGNGDKKTLKTLLTQSMYTVFAGEINARKKRKEKHQFTLIALTKSEVVDAMIKDGNAIIKMNFNSEFFKVVRDENDEIIEGSKNQTCKVDEAWSFQKNLRAQDPTWYLKTTSTQ